MSTTSFQDASSAISPVHQKIRDLGLKPIVVQITVDDGVYKVCVRLRDKPLKFAKPLFEEYNGVGVIYEVDGERITFPDPFAETRPDAP